MLAGETINFPSSSANRATFNDLPAGTVFAAIAFNGGGYSITGNSIGLTGVIMLPACAWLFLEGRFGWGVFLTLWAVFVVGGVDNFLRPLLISRGSRLPLAIVLTGVLGGLVTMGVLGIFIGAVLLGVVYVMLREWAEAEPLPAALAQADTAADHPLPR